MLDRKLFWSDVITKYIRSVKASKKNFNKQLSSVQLLYSHFKHFQSCGTVPLKVIT